MTKSYTAEGIAQDLLRVGSCNIPGIGKLKVVERKARKGRNPTTGEPMDIPAKKVVRLSPSSTITDRLNGA